MSGVGILRNVLSVRRLVFSFVVCGSTPCCFHSFGAAGFLAASVLHRDAGAWLFFLLFVDLAAAAVSLSGSSVCVLWLLAGSSAPHLFLFGFRFQLYTGL